MRRLNDWLESLPLKIRQPLFFGLFLLGFTGGMVLLYWIAGIQGG
jgi:hypothetical protein